MQAGHGLCGWVGVLGLSLVLASCSGGREPRHASATGARHMQVAPTADVPALVGASIDVLHQRLGTAQSLTAPVAAALPGRLLNPTDSLAAFRTGGLTLIASYDARSRRVRELLLLGRHEDSLMDRAHLRVNAAKYVVLPVFYPDSSFRLLGLRIVSTN